MKNRTPHAALRRPWPAAREAESSSATYPISHVGASAPPTGVTVGRYVLYPPFASGGMASVHIGRQRGPLGFSRTVAIKRLHAEFASDSSIVHMLMDEARLSARVQHPNVVSVLDVVHAQGEVFLVMDYIRGEALGKLARAAREQGEPIPLPIAIAIVIGALHGLDAAHEVRDEHGELLHLVHRDVSPQNILVGTDGVARIVDFGVAKAGSRAQTTRSGEVKGKLDYMAPEQIEQKNVTRKVDIYAASVVLWELLAGRRLLDAQDIGARLVQTLRGAFSPPSSFNPQVPQELDRLVLRGLARDPDARFETAREMAMALEGSCAAATVSAVGAWVTEKARDALAERDRRVGDIESQSGRGTLRELQPGPEIALGVEELVDVDVDVDVAPALHSGVHLQSDLKAPFEGEPRSWPGGIVSCSIVPPTHVTFSSAPDGPDALGQAPRGRRLRVAVIAGSALLVAAALAALLGRSPPSSPRRVAPEERSDVGDRATSPGPDRAQGEDEAALERGVPSASDVAPPAGQFVPSAGLPSPKLEHPARPARPRPTPEAPRGPGADFESLTRH